MWREMLGEEAFDLLVKLLAVLDTSGMLVFALAAKRRRFASRVILRSWPRLVLTDRCGTR